MSIKKINNKFSKDDFIEFKTLEFALKGDKVLAKKVLEIRRKLTTHGFEIFIRDYFRSLCYEMNIFTGGNKADGGIDIKGVKNGKKIFIQCKKYTEKGNYKGKVSEHELRDFFGGVVSEVGNCDLKNSYEMYFVTTGYFSIFAKKFANKNNIKLLNFKDIAKIELFEKFYSKYEKNLEIVKDYYSQGSLFEYEFFELDEKEKLKFWKNVRNHIVEERNLDELNVGIETFSDELLVKFGSLRSYAGLESLTCNYYEKNKIKKFEYEIKLGIEILQN